MVEHSISLILIRSWTQRRQKWYFCKFWMTSFGDQRSSQKNPSNLGIHSCQNNFGVVVTDNTYCNANLKLSSGRSLRFLKSRTDMRSMMLEKSWVNSRHHWFFFKPGLNLEIFEQTKLVDGFMGWVIEPDSKSGLPYHYSSPNTDGSMISLLELWTFRDVSESYQLLKRMWKIIYLSHIFDW